MDSIYLDHGATTPIDPEIIDGLAERQRTLYGNPESLHTLGRAAHRALEDARQRLAAQLGAKSSSILFTSGGTESLGMAMLGGCGQTVGPIVISAVEHPAVRESAAWLAHHRGHPIHEVPAQPDGKISPDDVAERLTADTRLVAVMLANNEVGAINDIPAIARLVRAHAPRARLVVDAVQAFGKRPIDVEALGADAVAITAHKLHGPKGIGALWIRRTIAPVFKGGGQERGIRGGTQSAPLAWAFAEAGARHLRDMGHIRALRDRLHAGLRAQIPDLGINGPPIGSHRLGNNLHVRIPGLKSEILINALTQRGVYASAGSACGGSRFSKVLSAMGYKESDGAFIRLTPGRFTTEVQIDAAITHFTNAVRSLR